MYWQYNWSLESRQQNGTSDELESFWEALHPFFGVNNRVRLCYTCAPMRVMCDLIRSSAFDNISHLSATRNLCAPHTFHEDVIPFAYIEDAKNGKEQGRVVSFNNNSNQKLKACMTPYPYTLLDKICNNVDCWFYMDGTEYIDTWQQKEFNGCWPLICVSSDAGERSTPRIAHRLKSTISTKKPQAAYILGSPLCFRILSIVAPSISYNLYTYATYGW